MEYLCHRWLRIWFVCHSHNSTLISSSMTYNRILTGVTRLVPLVEQELLFLPQHMDSSAVSVGFVLFDIQISVFDRSLFVLCSIGHCIVCPLNFGFQLLLVYLQAFLSSVCLRSHHFAFIFSFMTHKQIFNKSNTDHPSLLSVFSKVRVCSIFSFLCSV